MQRKIQKKFFCFSDNCISSGFLNLSLLRREYVSLKVNVLTNSPEILHITMSDFSNSIAFTVINKDAKGAVVEVSTVFGPIYHVACGRVFLNWTF